MSYLPLRLFVLALPEHVHRCLYLLNVILFKGEIIMKSANQNHDILYLELPKVEVHSRKWTLTVPCLYEKQFMPNGDRRRWNQLPSNWRKRRKKRRRIKRNRKRYSFHLSCCNNHYNKTVYLRIYFNILRDVYM